MGDSDWKVPPQHQRIGTGRSPGPRGAFEWVEVYEVTSGPYKGKIVRKFADGDQTIHDDSHAARNPNLIYRLDSGISRRRYRHAGFPKPAL